MLAQRAFLELPVKVDLVLSWGLPGAAAAPGLQPSSFHPAPGLGLPSPPFPTRPLGVIPTEGLLVQVLPLLYGSAQSHFL